MAGDGRGVAVRVIDGLEALAAPFERSVLTIGNFDGVHRAHQQLLAQAGMFSAETGAPVVVLTFEPHPLTVVAPQRAPRRLSTLDQKLQALQAAGADVVVVARSEPDLLNMEAPRFVQEVILDRFHPTHIVEGPSFGFGRGRKGTPELLRELAAPAGCEVYILEPVTLKLDGGESLMVSSSLVRKLLGEGDVRRAGLCLGHPYTLSGLVVEGDRRGRSLGFPTANLQMEDQLIPSDAVYAGSVSWGEGVHLAAISIGNTPTFGGSRSRVEAHLLDYSGDLYGRTIQVALERRLRSQRAFASPEALIEQLNKDVRAVRDRGDEVVPPGPTQGEE